MWETYYEHDRIYAYRIQPLAEMDTPFAKAMYRLKAEDYLRPKMFLKYKVL